MNDSPRPNENARVGGACMIAGGGGLVGFVVLSGIGGLMRDTPDMADLQHIGTTIVLGPFAILLILCGFDLRRHGRWW